MRRTRLTNTLALFALSLLLVAPAQQARQGGAPSAPPRLTVGEKLTYTVSYSNFADAAHVELYVAGRGSYFGREGVELRAHVETVGVVRAALLALDNYYFTYVDPQTGLPYRAQTTAGATPPPPTMRDAMDAAARTQDVTTVAAPAGAATVASAHDLISALFALRALPLAPGSSYPVSAQFQGTQYDAELRVTGRETVKTPAGSFNALAAQVRVRKNREADDLRLNVFFTDDERRVPVLVTARLRTGELRAALASDESVTTAAPAQLAAQPPQPQPTPRPTNDPARGGAAPRPATTHSAPPAGGGASGAANDLPFNVGEQLSFNFFLGNAAQPVGTAVLTVRSRGRYFNREGFLISATMTTAPPVDQVFPVRDNVVTYVSTTTLLPFRNELQQQEGTHRVQGVVSFDQERGSAVAADGKPIEIPVGTYDFISVLYAMRSFDLAPPKRNAVSLLINKRPRTLSITSVSRDQIDLGGQRISAYQLALSTDDARGDSLKLRLWIGSDKRRLPLRLTAVTPLGLVRADLSIIPLTRQ
ncbi:MAG: DUF3108 domain-containing protein [Pyrinomonadaceae bacterium]